MSRSEFPSEIDIKLLCVVSRVLNNNLLILKTDKLILKGFLDELVQG